MRIGLSKEFNVISLNLRQAIHFVKLSHMFV